MKKILTMFLVLFIFSFLITSQTGCSKNNNKNNTEEIKSSEDPGSSEDLGGTEEESE